MLFFHFEGEFHFEGDTPHATKLLSNNHAVWEVVLQCGKNSGPTV